MIPKIFSGCLLELIIVVTPVSVAIPAAMSFVSIPPVPKLDPKVVVLTDRASTMFNDPASNRNHLGHECLLLTIRPLSAWQLDLSEDSMCKDRPRRSIRRDNLLEPWLK